MQGPPEHEQGEFNQAIAYLYRIDEIFRRLNLSTVTTDYEGQYKLLKTLYKEMYPMMSDAKKGETFTERERFKQMMDWINADMDKYMKAKRSNRRVRISRSIFNNLDQFEIHLRNLTQDKGMLMPKKKDARWAL